jgi:methylthioribose-1-phosphate isomerase
MVETIQWTEAGVVMIDQTRLPLEETYVTCATYQQVADAIKGMIIRGAPAIGVAAAMGVALGVEQASPAELDSQFNTICETLAGTRPTAVNLFWAIDRMKKLYCALRGKPVEEIRRALKQEALRVREEDIEICRAIGRNGAPLVPERKTVLTHCNAGALATAGYGTALGVIRAAVEAGRGIDVFADETRPFLQGARLTAWELQQDGIPCTLITDNMAGHFLKSGRIGCVVVGADRIAANGDVANKIGTYSVAVLAKENNVPFYVAAPISTLDLTLTSGDSIPIEQRPASEVTSFFGASIAPANIAVQNPAFDVTPARYVSAIITELGVARAPFEESLGALVKGRRQ